MTISPERTGQRVLQFGLAGGHCTDYSPQLLLSTISDPACDPAASGAPRDCLAIICEPVELSPRAVPVSTSVMAAIREIYEESDRDDPVEALDAALWAANDVLYSKNRAGDPNLRVFLGVTCLVLRGHELIICQVPPTQVIIAQNGEPVTLPELASWRGDYQPQWRDAEGPYGLGMHAEAVPQFFRAELEHDDLITLCSSNLARLLASEGLGPLVGSDPRAAHDYLTGLAERHQLNPAYAMVIEPLLEAEQPVARSTVQGTLRSLDRDTTSERAGVGSTTWIERGLREMRERARVMHWPAKRHTEMPRRIVPLRDDIALEEVADGDVDGEDDRPLALAYRHGHQHGHQEVAEQAYSSPAPGEDETGLAGAGRPAGPDHWSTRFTPPERGTRRWNSAEMGWDDEVEQAHDSHHLNDTLADDDDWHATPRRVRRGRGIGQALSGAGALLVLFAGTLIERVRPGSARRTSYDRERVGRSWPLGSLERWDNRHQTGVNWWRPLGVLTLIGILVLGTSFGWRRYQARAAENRFTVALADVTSRREAALASRDRVAAHGQLLALRDSLTTIATTDQPSREQRVAAERDALAGALDTVDGVERLGGGQIELLATVPTSASNTGESRSQVVSGNGQTFMLVNGVVYSVGSQGKTASKLLTKGDKIGGVAVDQLLGIAWRVDKLLVFDVSRAYLRDSAGAWMTLPLAASGFKPPASDTFDGNLYLLAPERGQIVKFPSGVYASAPQPWSSAKASGDLKQALDMTIDKDVYVLTADGRILDFYQGEMKSAYAPTVVPPLAGATALYTASEGRYLYVVDPQEGRIVRLTRDGNVVGIYKAAAGEPAFTGAREIAVDEAAGLAYVLTDEGLLSVRLPAPKQ